MDKITIIVEYKGKKKKRMFVLKDQKFADAELLGQEIQNMFFQLIKITQ